MARPKSDDKRSAIVSAAIRVIAGEGLGAATAAIAKEAGVSNGSLFTYFETKADLLNRLYVELKTEMAAVGLDGLPTRSGIRKQAQYMWSHLAGWGASFPEKRRTLAQLIVSDDITPESREAGHRALAGVANLLERSRERGPMRDAPLALVVALFNAHADATVDFMIKDPANADKHCAMSFDAFWRMVA
jgi:AcrR family transcriptional regulator